MTTRALVLLEVLVLAGSVALADGTRCAAGDYAAAAQGTALQVTATNRPDGAVLLAGQYPTETTTLASSPSPMLLRHGVLQPPWGYRDEQNGTDRLPLRYHRWRGEATWLLSWPAGYTGCATRASQVSLDVFLLEGDLCLIPCEAPLQAGQYAFVPQPLLAHTWSTTAGCKMLLRSRRSLDERQAGSEQARVPASVAFDSAYE